MVPLSEQTILIAGARALGMNLEPSHLAAFARYQSLLLEWNQRVNLTAITDPAEVQVRHFLDALSCTAVTGDLNGRRFIDVGTGAGFPGLPLKIVFPDMELTLVDSVAKKCAFLVHTVEELALEKVTVINDRAETLGHHPAHREQYHWATARSVAHLSVLAEYLLPFCKRGGHLLALKGESAVQEAEDASPAVARLGGGPARLEQVTLAGLDRPHYLVVIERIGPTPPDFPRRPGVPGKRPLA
jgi:16S rRNA (guanine527-N7)-methyltransferase